MRTCFAAVVPLLLCSCAGGSILNNRVPAAKDAEDLGTIGMSAVSVTRWQDVAGELESKFPIDDAKLLEEAASPTSTISTRLLDALTARLAITIGGTQVQESNRDAATRSRSASREFERGKPPVDKRSRSEDETSSFDRTESRTTPGVPGLEESKDRELADFRSGPPDERAKVSAFNRYTYANSLRQELVILNRYIRDAVRRTGYEPYLVRMNFALQPRRRQQPYDVTLRVSFLPKSEPALIDAWEGADSPGEIVRLETVKRNDVNVVQTSEGQSVTLSGEETTFSRRLDRRRDTPKAPISLDRTRRPATLAALFGVAGATGVVDESTRSQIVTSQTTFGDMMETLKNSAFRSLAEDLGSYRLHTNKAEPDEKVWIVRKPCFFWYLARHLDERYGSAPGFDAAASGYYEELAASGRFAPAFFEQMANPEPLLAAQCGNIPERTSRFFSAWRERYNGHLQEVPLVIPLVATDVAEGTRENELLQQIRQAAFALGGSGGRIGGRFAIERTAERLEEFEAIRLNAIYSIGRAAENVLQLRFGAARYGRRYEMVTRNVQSSFLLLVPREQAGRLVEAVARPSYNNAETGARLALTDTDPNRIAGQKLLVHRKVAQHLCGDGDGSLTGKRCREMLTNLSEWTTASHGWGAFLEKLGENTRGLCGHRPVRTCVTELWAELQREQQSLHVITRSPLEIPALTLRDLPQNQVAIMLDGAERQITLAGVDPLLKDSLRARYGLTCEKGPLNGMMATQARYDADRVTFTFPKPASEPGVTPDFRLCVWLARASNDFAGLGLVDGSSPALPRTYQVALIERPAEKPEGPSFDFRVPAQTVVSTNGVGDIAAEVAIANTRRAARVRITAEGGVIIDAASLVPGAAVRAGDAFAADVTKSTAVTLRLRGLSPSGGLVTLVATPIDAAGAKGAEKSITLATVAAPKSAPAKPADPKKE